MVDKVYTIKDYVVTEIKNGSIRNENELTEYIDEMIDNSVIYYSDCFEIVQQAGVTDFSEYIDNYGATNISSIAYWVLRDLVGQEIQLELEEVLEEYICEECECLKDECECEEE